MFIARSILARTAAIAAVSILAIVVVGVTFTGWRPAGPAAATAAATNGTDTTKGITVQGVGKVTLTPDLATISLGVQTQASKASAAQALASGAMTKIIAAIKGLGVADKDLETQWVSLAPQYTYSANGSTPPKVVGYQANQSLTIKVRKIDDSGAVIDAAITAGATQVGGISFSVSDPAAATTQARTAAVADAKSRAKALADAAGVSLGSAISITETSAPAVVPYPYADKAGALAGGVSTPIQVGTTEVEVDVQVVFAIG